MAVITNRSKHNLVTQDLIKSMDKPLMFIMGLCPDKGGVGPLRYSVNLPLEEWRNEGTPGG